MSGVKKGGLGGLVLPLLFAALLVFGYWTYWRSVADRIESKVRAALPTALPQNVHVNGFPYRLTLELKDVKLIGQSGFGFSASKIVATASPLNPLLWVLEGATEPALAVRNGVFRPLQATTLQASLRLKSDGIERFSVTFEGIRAFDRAGGSKLWSTGAGETHLVADPNNADILAARFDLKDITLNAPLEGPGAILGQKITRVMLAGPIDKAPALMRSLADWGAAKGRMNIMAGEIAWGPVSLAEARGTLSLDGALKWQGQIKGQGALKPEGVAVAGLSTPIEIDIEGGRPSLRGMLSLDLGGALNLPQ